MKKIAVIFFLVNFLILGQEGSQSQSIELPDFVITGKESISIPKIQKTMSDFIPLLSQDFFTPDFPNNEKTTVKLSEVETEVLGYNNISQLTKALLRFSAGLETWPSGEFFYNDWSSNFSYDFNIFGNNELEYVKNAGVGMAGGSLGGKYFVDHNSTFLPGLEISFRGNYLYELYNFYGFSDPSLERITDNGLFDISFNYVSDPNNIFGISFSDSYFNMRDTEIDENIFGLSAYYKLRYDDLDLKIQGIYKNQAISGSSLSIGNQSYFNSSISAGLFLYDMINLKAGIYLAEMEGNTFFSPSVFASIKLSKSLSLFGAFSPYADFKSLKNFNDSNRYFQSMGVVNTFVENRTDLKFALKYEYEKYFEISGGLGYINSRNNFYFEDNINDGFFNINLTDSENSFAFLNFLFRKGPFGQFYGDVKLQQVKAKNNKSLPYSSNLIGKFSYSYDWELGFGSRLGIIYFGESYSNIENSEKIPSIIDLNASFYYELFSNFQLTLEFQNLLNKKYYYFRNYEAKPFDVLFGFEFRW